MPAILERLVRQLSAKGYPKSNAYAIATAKLQESGNLKRGTTQATAKGKRRGRMTPGERAKDRASKYSSRRHKPSAYKYNARTNRAVLRKYNKRKYTR